MVKTDGVRERERESKEFVPWAQLVHDYDDDDDISVIVFSWL